MNASDYIQRAINVVSQRISRNPEYPIYLSCEKQLHYIKSIVDKTETDKSRLKDLTIGMYSAKEFDDTDPELAKVLGEAYYIANQIKRGLKVVLPK